VLLILNRSVFPLQRFFEVVIIVQAPVCCFVVARPGKSADAPKLVLDATQRDALDVHGDIEGYRQLFPAKCRCRRLRLHILEGISQRVFVFGWPGLHGYAQRILLLVITKAAPRRRILRKRDRPLIRRGKHVQAIGARGQRVALDGNLVAELDRGVLVCSRTPCLAVRNRCAEYLPPIGKRSVIDNRDVRQANPLRDGGPLAERRQVQLARLAAILELRVCLASQTAEPQQNTKRNPIRFAHGRTFLPR